MNKNQWYASGIIFSVSFVMSTVSIVRFAAMPMDAVTFAVWSGLYHLLGKVCLLGAAICFICGWLEKEGVQ